MTNWLKTGDAIPDCRPVRYRSYNIFRSVEFSPRNDHVSEDDRELCTFQREGVLVFTPRDEPHDVKTIDRVQSVTTLYPWHTVNSVITEQHIRAGEHHFEPIDVQPPEDIRDNYPNGVGMWCETCETIRPLTAEETAQVAAGEEVATAP